jgi:predicted amidohydrolase
MLTNDYPHVVDNCIKTGYSVLQVAMQLLTSEFLRMYVQMYVALRKLGAQVLLVPAAFTVPTGTAHW